MARHTDLDELVAELAEAQHGAFALQQLGPLWCDRRLASQRVRRWEWERPFDGVYLLPAAVDEWSVAAAMCLYVPGAALGSLGAALWWRLDGTPAGRAAMLAPAGGRTRHPLLRRSRDLAAWETCLDRPDGCLRITDPTRTLIDAAAESPPDALERMIESAIRRGMTSHVRLAARARQLRRPGRAGPAALLEVLQARPGGGGADSDGEVILLQLIRAAGLPAPRRQVRIGSAFFDLGWPDRKVLVELDGATHRTAERTRRDARKQNRAVLEGWTVLRFTWDRIEREPDAVLAEIRAALMTPMSA